MGFSQLDISLNLSIYRLIRVNILVLLGVIASVGVVAVGVAAVCLVDVSISGVVGGSGLSSVLAVDILLRAIVAVDICGLAFAPVAATIVSNFGVVAVVSVVAVVVAVINVGAVVAVVAVFNASLALVNLYFGALVNVLAVVNHLALALIDVDICGLGALINILGLVADSVVIVAVVGIMGAVVIVAVINDAVVIVAVVNAIFVDELERHKVQFRLLNIERACKSHCTHHQCAAEETCAQNFSKLFHCHFKSLLSLIENNFYLICCTVFQLLH